MKQLTIRGFDKRLEREIRELAAREGVSLNKAVLRLLRRGAGLKEPESALDVVGASLDHLAVSRKLRTNPLRTSKLEISPTPR